MKSQEIKITKLKQINIDEGNVLHALKKSDSSFKSFGEIYFSLIKFNKIKAWKKHNRLTLNLIVPFGNVEFVIKTEKNRFKKYLIGTQNYQRLTIPPGFWFGFKGIDNPYSIVASIIDEIHDPKESEKKEIKKFTYNW